MIIAEDADIRSGASHLGHNRLPEPLDCWRRDRGRGHDRLADLLDCWRRRGPRIGKGAHRDGGLAGRRSRLADRRGGLVQLPRAAVVVLAVVLLIEVIRDERLVRRE